MITATKRFNFCYGHSLPSYKGKCVQMHGHNADLEVTVKGPVVFDYIKGRPLTYPTMVEDFSRLKEVVREEVEKILDHEYINEVIPDHPPTAEIIALWIWRQLYRAYGSNLVKIRLSEGPTSWVTVIAGERTQALVLKYFGGKYEDK